MRLRLSSPYWIGVSVRALLGAVTEKPAAQAMPTRTQCVTGFILCTVPRSPASIHCLSPLVPDQPLPRITWHRTWGQEDFPEESLNMFLRVRLDIGQRIDANTTGHTVLPLVLSCSWAVFSQILTENRSPSAFCVIHSCFTSY